MFRSNLGPDVAAMVQTILPLGPESNFVPTRDVTRVFTGVYAMQGADFCSVVQGNFDLDAIRRSIDARTVSLAGVPLTKSRYADTDLYTSGNIGFTCSANSGIRGSKLVARRLAAPFSSSMR